ncbi:HAD family hydrolase [Bacillus daqingensis]|uniref:HAD family hydrolase n=1 Tax=Bacillus daqingensis TaxID=872396 RepID=A0ABV9NWB3_9BACI
MKNVLLFDFDGTLADSLPLCLDAFEHAFAEAGVFLTREQIQELLGPPETDVIRTQTSDPRAVDAFYSFYEQRLDQIKALPGLKDKLQQLIQDGFQLGIISGKASRSLTVSMEHLQIADCFAFTAAGDVYTPKPDPEALQAAAKQFGAEIGQLLMIGDTDADIGAAAAAGATGAAVDWFPDYEPEPLKQQPDVVFHSWDDLITYVTRNR